MRSKLIGLETVWEREGGDMDTHNRPSTRVFPFRYFPSGSHWGERLNQTSGYQMEYRVIGIVRTPGGVHTCQ